MKKRVFFAALACLAVACQTRLEEDFRLPSGLIRATIEDTETRTSLQPGTGTVSSVLWSEADEIAVFLDGATQAKTFTLSEGAGTKQATFKGDGAAQNYVAFYPKKMVSSLSGDNVRINLPTEQEYKEGSFASGTYPMLASGSSSSLQFRNLASILRISLTGKHSVTRIVFTSAQKSVKVCGQATASVSSQKLSVTSNGRDSVALNVGGVQLKETEPTDFFLVLPPQTYKGGFTVRVYTGDRYMDKTYPSDFTMERSRLHKADAFAFQPGGVDVSTSLEGSGTSNDPFLIGELGDLVYFQQTLNAGGIIGEVKAAEAAYRLTADIDLSPVCSEARKKNWTPIGTEEHPFAGSFDGDGHTVSGLYINTTAWSQALFGYVAGGSVTGLSVQGSVKSSGYYVALVVAGGKNMQVSSCSVDGTVESQGSFVGGIVGNGGSGSTFSHCVNRAKVDGVEYVAGVVGLNYGTIQNCVNYGEVNGSYSVGGVGGCTANVYNSANYGDISGSRNKIGGVSGNHNNGYVANCQNEGTVTGGKLVGGITGYSRQWCNLWNSVNRGKVSGEGPIGGICGQLSSDCSAYNPSTLRNCLNLGAVQLLAGSDAGGITGFNEGADDASGFLASELTQSYWLWDSARSLGMATGIGRDEGVSSGNYPLTDDEMKGAEASRALYRAYTKVLDALNAWAYEKKDQFKSISLWGWKADGADGYPVLTGLEAQPPGSDGSAFKVSPASIQVASALGGDFSIEVISTSEYEVSVPDWIIKGDVSSQETDRYVKIHHFSAGANLTGAARSGQITFTNAEGKALNVSVKQAYAYLKTDLEDLIFTASGGVKRFNVTASIDWKVSADAAWITIEPASGSGDSVVGVRASANEGESARTATLSLSSADGSITYTAQLVQAGAASGEDQKDWREAQFVHQSVAMRFTATWCGWCPRMNKTIKRAQELYPDHIQHLALHGGGSDLQFSSISPLQSLYSVNAFPTGLVDGRTKVGNGEIESTAQTFVRLVKETEDTYGTVTGAAISSSTSGRSADIAVEVYLKKAGYYKLTVLLVEDGIVNAQSDYEEGDHPKYVHDCVARMAVTNVLGDAFSASDDFTVKQFSYNVTVPSTYNMTNMRVFVYIQREYSGGSFGDYFIDNCATVDLGGSLKLQLEGSIGGGGESGGGDGNEGITPGGDIDM